MTRQIRLTRMSANRERQSRALSSSTVPLVFGAPVDGGGKGKGQRGKGQGKREGEGREWQGQGQRRQEGYWQKQ
eukprot:7365771-Lingulodinium_polyedra.AAC.1